MGGRGPFRRGMERFVAFFLVTLPIRFASAHSTVLPHHRQDLEDLATGRDKRGVVLLITFAFVSLITSLVAVIIRQTKTAKPVEDVRAAQERLRRNVMHVVTTIRPLLDDAPDRIVARAVQAYGQITHRPLPPQVTEGSLGEFRFGDDVVTIEVTEEDAARRTFRIRATTETAGAEIVLFADGRSSISIFAVQDEARFAALAE